MEQSSPCSGQLPTKVDLHLLVQYQLKGAIVMEPQIITKPAFKAAGYELKTTMRDGANNREIPAFWDTMTMDRLKILHNRLHSVGKAEFGLCFPPDLVSGDFSYVIAVEVSDFNDVPADMFTAEIPEALYAIFTTPADDGAANIAPAIQGTWKYIFETWFPNSGYEFAHGKADFEWYPCTNQGEKVKIYIPIVKKERV
jgi:AraC family transcriptional regulator